MNLERAGGRTKMDQKEKGKKNVEIGGGIASGGHCRLQRNVLHEL